VHKSRCSAGVVGSVVWSWLLVRHATVIVSSRSLPALAYRADVEAAWGKNAIRMSCMHEEAYFSSISGCRPNTCSSLARFLHHGATTAPPAFVRPTTLSLVLWCCGAVSLPRPLSRRDLVSSRQLASSCLKSQFSSDPPCAAAPRPCRRNVLCGVNRRRAQVPGQSLGPGTDASAALAVPYSRLSFAMAYFRSLLKS
jgi:hypothetical protein